MYCILFCEKVEMDSQLTTQTHQSADIAGQSEEAKNKTSSSKKRSTKKSGTQSRG
jgi:hypothetical protein